MNKTFLGKPSKKIEDFIKDKSCDIFMKKDGTKVRPNYNPSKTTINIYYPQDELGIPMTDIDNFSFGTSYVNLDDGNLEYSDATHGIDLSRTKIDSFNALYLNDNQLTSFELPASLQSFDSLYLYGNQLTSFQLPASLQSFDSLDLDNNQLTSVQLPASLQSFNSLELDSNQLSSFQLPASLQSFNALGFSYNQLSSFQLPDSIQSFYDLYLNSNQLSSFQLPASLQSFNVLNLDSNQLTSFQLPASLQSFDNLYLNSNQLTSFQLPASLTSFYNLYLNNKQYNLEQPFILDMTLFDDPTAIPTISEYGNIYGDDYDTYQGSILVKNEVMFNAFKAADKWKDFADSQYTWEGK